jgi:hypothetical protein
MQGSYTCTEIFLKYISGANKILFQGFLRGKSYPKLLLHTVLKALDECPFSYLQFFHARENLFWEKSFIFQFEWTLDAF